MERSALRQLLPHAGDALWLQRLLRPDGDSAYAEADRPCGEAGPSYAGADPPCGEAGWPYGGADWPHGGADWLCAETDWSCLARFGADASPALLFEAAAQLCAVHGALQKVGANATQAPSATDADHSTAAVPGTAMLGKLSDLRLHFEPTVRTGTLAIRVDRQAASAAGAQYTFAVHSGERLLLDGTLLLVLAHA